MDFDNKTAICQIFVFFDRKRVFCQSIHHQFLHTCIAVFQSHLYHIQASPWARDIHGRLILYFGFLNNLKLWTAVQ